MKILAATDFSAPAEHAVDLAGALAARLNDDVVLLFAVEPTLVTSPDFMVDVESLERAIEDKAKARIEEEADRLRRRGVRVQTVIKRGHVAELVHKVAEEEEPRLVVVGTHGRRALSRLFLGSAAERVVLESPRPVVVVRESGDEGLRAWAYGERPLHLIVAVDQSATSAHAIQFVRKLREIAPVDVTFLHYYWPPEQFSRLGYSLTRDVMEPDPDTVAVIERSLRGFVGQLPGQGRIAFQIEPNWGELGSQLAEKAEALDGDLLVMGTHQRHGLRRLWLGATTQPTLHASQLPVLCVPGPEGQVAQPVKTPAFRDVLVTTDLSSLGNSAVPYAYGLVQDGGSVRIVHVHERHLPNPFYADAVAGEAFSGSGAEERTRAALEALIPTDAAEREIKTEIQILDGGYPPNAIIQAANRADVDALVIASHGRAGLGRALVGSVTSAVVEAADRPVMVVRGLRA